MWQPSLMFGRLLTIAAVGLTVVAVALGRYCPNPPELRSPAVPRYRPVRYVGPRNCDRDISLLDAETGALARFPLSGKDRMLFAACSPWRDDRARTHVVGLWMEDDTNSFGKSGLARATLPDTTVVDRIELDVLLQGPPCWPPGTGAWVIYAGMDGRLYRLAFDDSRTGPLPVVWRCPPPWGRGTMILDPTWPCHPRFAAMIVVALRHDMVGREPSLPPGVESQLWWLRLEPRGAALEAAGRLIVEAPHGSREEPVSERFPALTTTLDGRLVLAYLARRRDESELRLRLAPVTIDAATGAPRVDAPSIIEVATGRAPSPAAFSGDGCWLFSFPDRSPLPIRAERWSVAEALDGPPVRGRMRSTRFNQRPGS